MTAVRKTWYAVDVLIDPAGIEAVEHALNELGCLGTEMDSLRKPQQADQVITGFFDAMPELSEVRSAVNDSLTVHGQRESAIRDIRTRVVEETDWLAEWKKHWRPQTVGLFVIAPPWDASGPEDKILITIEPNMAFGTGTHETTQLCLEAVSERYSPEKSFLDVGTGTGILAIAAAKLGGSSIFACDTDFDSIKIARENAVLNGVDERITYLHGPLPGDTPQHDFTCANLTLDVILPILDHLLTKTGSTLVLSGILFEQQEAITEALKVRAIDDPQVQRSGEWISVTIDLS